MAGAIEIWRLTSLEAEIGEVPWLQAGMARVFQEAATRWPADPKAQAEFHELWLGGYLREDRDLAYVALDHSPNCQVAEVIGYLVGSKADQVISPRFAVLDYFKGFAPHFSAFPAHLHMNVDVRYRGQGIGRRLIGALAGDLKAQAVPGVHIVTARAQRNVRFYEAAGFSGVAQTVWNGHELVLMGLNLR
jgi:ribosomal protein S18 acetylase RimI-like enzyme